MANEFLVIGVHTSSDLSEIRNRFSLDKYSVFSGGARHYQLVKDFLPASHEWIDIRGSLTELFERYNQYQDTIVCFASGDPLFFGMANTIRKYIPRADVRTYPAFNSLQLLCHKAMVDYSQMHTVSVHGRSWGKLDEALIRGNDLIGVLTDGKKSPSAIAARMLEYNFTNYKAIVGEDLEGKQEKISTMSLKEAMEKAWHELNCLLLLRMEDKDKYYGIDDHLFEGLVNRPAMITKKPARLLTLSQLNLVGSSSLWDIGFCTGSVSIEARLQFPHVRITAFEKRPECNEILEINTRKFSAPGIHKVMGDFFEQKLDDFPAPDTVFIGGHGGRLEEMLFSVDKVLKAGGRIVMNAVREANAEVFINTLKCMKYTLLESTSVKVNDHNTVVVLAGIKNNKLD